MPGVSCLGHLQSLILQGWYSAPQTCPQLEPSHCWRPHLPPPFTTVPQLGTQISMLAGWHAVHAALGTVSSPCAVTCYLGESGHALLSFFFSLCKMGSAIPILMPPALELGAPD